MPFVYATCCYALGWARTTEGGLWLRRSRVRAPSVTPRFAGKTQGSACLVEPRLLQPASSQKRSRRPSVAWGLPPEGPPAPCSVWRSPAPKLRPIRHSGCSSPYRPPQRWWPLVGRAVWGGAGAWRSVMSWVRSCAHYRRIRRLRGLCTTGEAFVYAAMAHLMARRLERV